MWNSLTDITQANILEKIGGKRNSNVVSSLLENFDTVEKVLATVGDAEGSALAENEKYLDSINGKISLFKSSVEALSSSLIDSSAVKAVVDIGTGFVDVLTTLQNIHMLLPSIIALLTTASSISKMKDYMDSASKVETIVQGLVSGQTSIDAFATSVASLTRAQKKMVVSQLETAVSSKKLESAQRDQIVQTLGLATAEGTLTTVNHGLAASFKALFKSNPLGWIITAASLAIEAIMAISDAIAQNKQEMIDAANEVIDTYAQANSTFDTNSDSLENMRDRFEALSRGVDDNGKNISLTAEEYNEYLGIVKQICNISPDIVTGYDNEGNAVLNYKSALDEAIRSQEALLKSQRDVYLGNGQELFAGKAEEYKDAQRKLSKIGVEISNELNSSNYFKSGTAHIDAYNAAFEELGITFDKFGTWQNSYDQIIQLYENHDQFINMLRSSGTYAEEELNNLSNTIRSVAGAYSELKAIQASQVDYLMEWSKDKDWYDELGFMGVLDEFKEGLESVVDPSSFDKSLVATEEFGSKLKEAMESAPVKEILDLSAGLENGTVTLEEYNAAVANLQNTWSGNETVLPLIVNHLSSLTNGYSQLTDSTSEAARSAADFNSVFTEEMSKSVDSVQSNIKTLGDALTKLGEGTLELGDVIDLIQQFPELAEYVDLTADGFGDLDAGLRKLMNDSPKELIKTLQGLKETNNLTDEAANKIDILCEALSDLPTDSVGNLAEEWGIVADKIDDANRAQSEIDKAFSGDDYNDGLEARIKYFKEFQDLIDNGEIGSKKYKSAQSYFGLEGKSLDEIKAWSEQSAKYYAEDYKDGLRAFLDEISNLNSSGLLSEDIASYQDGILKVDNQKLDEFAAALDWPTELLMDFLNAYRMVSDYVHNDPMNNWLEFDANGLILEGDNGLVVSMSKMREYTHQSEEDVRQIIDDINQLDDVASRGGIKLIDDAPLKEWKGWDDAGDFAGESRAKLQDALEGLNLDLSDFLSIKNGTGFDDILTPLLQDIGWAQDEIDELRTKMFGKSWALEATIDGVKTDELDKVISNLENLDISVKVDENGALVVTQELIDGLSQAGADAQQIQQILTDLNGRDDVTINAGLEFDGKSVDDFLDDIESDSDNVVEMTVNMKVNDENLILGVQAAEQNVQEALGDGWEVVLSADSTDAEEKAEKVKKLLEGLPPNTLVTVNGRTATVQSELQKVTNFLDRIKRDKNQTISISYVVSGAPNVSNILSGASKGSVVKARNANGTRHAKRGPSLLGDEYSPTGTPKPELVVSKDHAYLAGVDGPTVGYLNEGDVVYTNRETKKILNGKNGKQIADSIPAFGLGTGNTLGQNHTSYIPGTGTPQNSGNVNVSVKATLDDRDLEEKLKDTLDKMKEDIDEIIGNFEHQIFLMEKRGASAIEIADVYRKMQEAVHEQAEKYRAQGLDENSDYIQELQKQWYEYHENIQRVIVEDYEKSVTERENAITLTENWLENAIRDRNLFDIQRFSNDIVAYYQRMQDLLHQQAEYYRSQGYADTSDEVSKLSDMWQEYADNIREVKQRVVDDLVDMVSTASDAVDKIQNVFDTLKSAADEYAANNGYISVDAFQKIVDLGPEYMQYLEDENGLLVINEENINKVIAAKTRQLALESAASYVERLRLALQSDSIEDLNQLLYATTETTNATWGLIYANLALLGLNEDQYKAAVHNIDAIRALAENAVAGIGKTSESLSESLTDMKSGLDDIVKYVMEMLKKRIQDQIKGLEDMKDAYSDIIKLRKESLKAAKDESGYQDSIAEKTKKIAELQERITALSLDNSREAQSERIKLEEEMANLQKELGDIQGDHALESQEKVLDEMEDAYHKEKDAEIEILEKKMSSYQKLYDEAIAYIKDKWITNWDSLLVELKEWNYEYGTDLESTIVKAWENINAAIRKYGNPLDALEKIDKDIEASGSGNQSNNVVVGTPNHDHNYSNEDLKRATVDQMRRNSANWLNSSAPERARLDQENIQHSETLKKLGMPVERIDGAWYLTSTGERLYNIYDNGYVGTQDQIRKLVAEMKQNSANWVNASESQRVDLQNRNNDIGKTITALGVDVYRNPNDGVWYLKGGNRRLFDVYHSGGTVGNNPTLKQNEVMALLEKGELVLDKQRENGLYRLIDFASEISKRFKEVLSNSISSNALKAPISALTEGVSHVPENISNVESSSIQFGDVIINGANSQTVEQHREVNRRFTNDILNFLNLSRR